MMPLPDYVPEPPVGATEYDIDMNKYLNEQLQQHLKEVWYSSIKTDEQV